MKIPSQYELKKWLCDNTIRGVILHHYHRAATGDTSETDWELRAETGEVKRVLGNTVINLVCFTRDLRHILGPSPCVRKEVEDYRAFEKASQEELETYLRLKEKFEGVITPTE
jgi:hypothetical protein